MDPISMIVGALVAGATVALKDTAAQAIKDAYAGLKSLIVNRYGSVAGSVLELEKSPDSDARAAVVQEGLGKTDAAQNTELLDKARALIKLVEEHDPEVARTFGLDLRDISGKSLKATDVIAESSSGPATAVQVGKAKIREDIEFKGIRATDKHDPKA